VHRGYFLCSLLTIKIHESNVQKHTYEKILCTDAQNNLSLAVKLNAIRHKAEHQLYDCKALDLAGVTELPVLKNKDKSKECGRQQFLKCSEIN
jgi:hypothetical protein